MGKIGCYTLVQLKSCRQPAKNPGPRPHCLLPTGYWCDSSNFLSAGKASCKKINSLAVCGASLAWSLAIVRPATEIPFGWS